MNLVFDNQLFVDDKLGYLNIYIYYSIITSLIALGTTWLYTEDKIHEPLGWLNLSKRNHIPKEIQLVKPGTGIPPLVLDAVYVMRNTYLKKCKRIPINQ